MYQPDRTKQPVPGDKRLHRAQSTNKRSAHTAILLRHQPKDQLPNRNTVLPLLRQAHQPASQPDRLSREALTELGQQYTQWRCNGQLYDTVQGNNPTAQFYFAHVRSVYINPKKPETDVTLFFHYHFRRPAMGNEKADKQRPHQTPKAGILAAGTQHIIGNYTID